MIRDLYSNFELEAKYDTANGGTSVGGSASANTPAIDISLGTTTAVLMSLIGTQAAAATLTLSIQYSVDAAFTTPVNDPGNLGNSFTDVNGADLVQPLSINDADPRNTYALVNIVNPASMSDPETANYKYARVVVTNSHATNGASFTAVSMVGPQRLVEAE